MNSTGTENRPANKDEARLPALLPPSRRTFVVLRVRPPRWRVFKRLGRIFRTTHVLPWQRLIIDTGIAWTRVRSSDVRRESVTIGRKNISESMAAEIQDAMQSLKHFTSNKAARKGVIRLSLDGRDIFFTRRLRGGRSLTIERKIWGLWKPWGHYEKVTGSESDILETMVQELEEAIRQVTAAAQ